MSARLVPLSDRYRPTRLADVLSQSHVVNILQECLRTKAIPHMLFYGPPGCGKTSTIIALCRELYGHTYKTMILELNGSDDRGINVIRTQIKNFAKLKNVTHAGLPKIIVLDEADSLTYDAQFALRRVIEKYTSNVRFCLICNYINKLIPAVQSRCMIFRFNTVQSSYISGKVRDVLNEESIQMDNKILDELVLVGNGDFRKVFNFLHVAKCSGATVTVSSFYKHFFAVDEEACKVLTDLITKKKRARTKQTIQTVASKIQGVMQTHGLPFNCLLTLLTHIGKKIGHYNFLDKLADVEYSYYCSNNAFETLAVYNLSWALL